MHLVPDHRRDVMDFASVAIPQEVESFLYKIRNPHDDHLFGVYRGTSEKSKRSAPTQLDSELIMVLISCPVSSCRSSGVMQSMTMLMVDVDTGHSCKEVILVKALQHSSIYCCCLVYDRSSN